MKANVSFDPRPGADGVRRYWRGTPERPQHCRVAILIGPEVHQCRRRRGHGPQHAFCSQHARIFRRQEAGA